MLQFSPRNKWYKVTHWLRDRRSLLQMKVFAQVSTGEREGVGEGLKLDIDFNHLDMK